MITKGYIVEILRENNKFNVRIPFFETASMRSFDEKSSSVIYESTLCYQPGNLNSYNVGDCVFVGFEDNQLEKPIILGKLYLGEEKKATNYQFASSLKVEEKTILPNDTKIGDIHLSVILEALRNKDNINDNLEILKEEIKELKAKLSQYE